MRNVARSKFRIPRSAFRIQNLPLHVGPAWSIQSAGGTDKQPQRSTRFGGQLETSEPALAKVVQRTPHGGDRRTSQGLIDGPVKFVLIVVVHTIRQTGGWA